LYGAQQKDTVGVAFGALLTLFAHVVLVGMLFFVNPIGEGDEAADTLVLSVIETELLMYGEVMPTDGELPWIANPEEAPQESDSEPAPVPEEETTLPEQETVVIQPEPAADTVPIVQENRPEPVDHRPDLQTRPDRGETNPNRPENQRPTMGSQDGFQGGTSLSASALANQFAGIVRQLSRALRRPAAIPSDEYEDLEATVWVRCTGSGQITTWEFEQRSGNRLFDAAVESMLNRFRMGSDRLRLSSVSNAEIRDQMVSDGFRIPVRGGR
jgi:outer membrane biosynthesis protein TonB